jgi:SAM-dependent methyltransferase
MSLKTAPKRNAFIHQRYGERVSWHYRIRRARFYPLYYCKRLVGWPGTFTFEGRTYTYFWHPYSGTWRTERAVEIPIVWEMVRKNPAARVLEIGNVLSHYFPVKHEIVDKYERWKGVTNQDVCDFKPSRKYDLIVSISTLEHVGWDEEPREPLKVVAAFENLRSLLAPGGMLVVTLPLGYNPALDRLLDEAKIPFTHRFYLKCASSANEWSQVEAIKDAKYAHAPARANALVVGMVEQISPATSVEAWSRSTRKS